MKKYLIPPRLNEKFYVFGLTYFELGFIVLSFLIAILSKRFFLLAVPAFAFATCIRVIYGEMNMWQYGKKVYNYFFKPQKFSMTGGE